MGVFHYEKDDDGIVVVTMDMTGPVNAINAEYNDAMEQTVCKLESETDLTGVVFASAKTVFFAGADLKELIQADGSNKQKIFENGELIKGQFRRLEKLPVPVVAAINGAALGGGYELSLACNHRIAFNHKSVQIGLPECSLGLYPAGGGVVRLTKLIGVEKSLDIILKSKRLSPDNALKQGLIDQVVADVKELIPASKAWIHENKTNPSARIQPWDQKGYKVPGGPINSPKNAQMAVMAPTLLFKQARGLMPQMTAAMDIAFQSSYLDVDTMLRVEGREFVNIVSGPVAKNMINTFFFQLNKINSGLSRPKDIPKSKVSKLGILGAGMMGQGIAYVSARAGIDVVLKDMTQEAAEKGKAYSEPLLKKLVSRGKMLQSDSEKILNRITATSSDTDLQGCDLIIEAVFENLDLKHTITKNTESYLSDDGIWGSNTSTLPISELANAASKPDKFIGIHFFSPVDKMPLVEIIVGEKTDEETLAKAFDYAQQIRKTPIVVNDSLGFFTSRTFGTYLDEGLHLLVEGYNPIQIDNMGKAIGMPVGPLQVGDEVSLELTRKAQETWADMGVADKWSDGSVTRRVIKDMITDNGRGGRHHGGGYYEYHPDGSKNIWPGLYDLYFDKTKDIPENDMKDRLMFRQVIESLKCLETGVLRSVADGNIGSIMGIGAPAHTGGFLQFVNTYGLKSFIARCEELEKSYGSRFKCPQIVIDKEKSGDTFV
ncbi:MAG: 3-hydroxyacyl-CoA dehydrogenase NAD-binding domain-containing protein [Pseudomonadota bacterium]|jgi:3-hydroxyacyl-CoA dehydrogenase/enoyl-CoA hydratase/3-hydroxybutyryl-CoA epimerase|nr:3-hydroxyacyl-CoA dehydrogenase NAD-binding domain-containing protein [Porticoccaceae bacterium]MED5561081.1 3-hydroxyacyl-CoA dehydrogenase NAD-binding domain-containing protein [Pseudomonadota bacterium]MED6344354.1 3-hydroxyacyl-CoA dehydrogenase NAD-binding domain-containing protein [Pseudomonadota bacterium]|tara:strand:- start:5345 stop:7492 length:2148 start_codon:yes stop_codon:yes gene_type:complete